MKRCKGTAVLLILFLGLMLLSTNLVYSQETGKGKMDEVNKLEDIVVTDRLVKGFEEKLHEEPATIHAITADEIEKLDVKRTLDLIRRIPGVTAENYNQQGVAAAYSFRGFRLGHGVGAASYLDGIPYNEINHVDGDGYPDYNTILPESIERLEVIKGLSSPMYGGYAQAGVLHYITKDRGDFNKIKLSAGSWNYHRAVAEVAREYDRFFTYNAVSAEQGDGYRDHSDWHGGNIFSRFGYKINEDSTVRATFHFYKTTWNAPGDVSPEDWDDNDLKDASTDGGGDKEKNMVSLDYSLKLNKYSNISLLAYGYHSDFTRWVGSNNEERHDDRDTYGARAMYNFSRDLARFRNNLMLGVDYEYVDSQARKWNTERPDSRVRKSQKISGDFDYLNTSLYFQEDFWPASFMKIMVGGRYEYFDGNLKNNLTNQKNSYTEDVFSPKGGILLMPINGLEIFGNIGTGFVLPSGYKKFENNSLEPSKLVSYDLGARYLPIPELMFQLSFYRTDTRDEVLVDPSTLEETNAGKTRRQGVEAVAEWYAKPDLMFYANGTYQDAKYMDYVASDGNFTGHYINRVPEWIVKTGMEYFPKLGFGGSLSAQYTGERWNDNANTIREDGYLVCDASLRYAFEKVTFTLFANNIFNKKYAELQSATGYSPADPFNVTLSCSLNF